MINDQNFAVIVRMMWIDDVIEEEGEIGREDIRRAFMVSIPQASTDLRRYRNANPERIAYDNSLKRYVKIEGSRPLFWGSARAAAAEIVLQVSDTTGAA